MTTDNHFMDVVLVCASIILLVNLVTVSAVWGITPYASEGLMNAPSAAIAELGTFTPFQTTEAMDSAKPQTVIDKADFVAAANKVVIAQVESVVNIDCGKRIENINKAFSSLDEATFTPGLNHVEVTSRYIPLNSDKVDLLFNMIAHPSTATPTVEELFEYAKLPAQPNEVAAVSFSHAPTQWILKFPSQGTTYTSGIYATHLKCIGAMVSSVQATAKFTSLLAHSLIANSIPSSIASAIPTADRMALFALYSTVLKEKLNVLEICLCISA